MARIAQDSTPVSPSTRPTQAQANSYGHGHASSVGHGHGVIRDSLRPAVPAAPVAQRVSVVTAVDETAEQPVALALRVHDEGKVLRPSLMPPRRGQRLPQNGLPSTPEQRSKMLSAHIEESRVIWARSILGR